MSVFYQNFAVNQWNENTASWSFLNSGSSLSQLRGYATNYRGTNPVLSFTGTFNNGTMSIGVSNASTSDGTYGWNLVGNPYPSVIDLQSSGWTWTNVDQTAYFYNGNSGSYATFNVSSGGTNGGTRYITPGQGFFVHANASSGTFGVSNAIRVAQSASFYKSGNNQNQLVRIKASNVLFETDMIIGFEDEASSNFDSNSVYFHLTNQTFILSLQTIKNQLHNLKNN